MRAMLLPAFLAAAAMPVAAASAATDRPPCRAILPALQSTSAVRPLVPEDLARLRDIGPVDPESFAAPFFTLSPDGRRAAFQLRQADPDANAYCLAMVIVDLEQREPPRIVDEGKELILLTIDIRGLAEGATGIPRVITPRWSPDGKWIAFLQRSGGTTQLWRAMADGSGSEPLTHSEADVVDFRFAPGGKSIVFATRPGLEQAHSAFATEGLRGWHYDDRFSPFARRAPFPLAPVDREAQVLDLASGIVRAPTPAEAALVVTDHELIATAGAPAAVDSPGLRIAATRLTGGALLGALRARLPDGSEVACTEPACEGASEPWWTQDRRRVRFQRREGWARASTAIYEWDPEARTVRRLYVTDDLLASCQPSGDSLICLRDSSLTPRRLERLDPASGLRELLFDPNPELASLELGRAERLHFRNAFGFETVADLVYPVGYREGRRYPLVVVQYDTRGFLRGGTGDEYPIQAFANRGFAVLSLSRPAATGDTRGAKDFEQGGRLNLQQFSDRKSVESSLERGVELVVSRGIADPKRIGITGLSDGASTVMWALVHSHLFAAAAMSTCCIDTTLAARQGPSAARHFEGEGYPGMLGRNDAFWNDISLSVNARRISTPILLQLADDEFLSSLETYTALREAGAPIDMFVFPDEHHNKWQPAHRLAVYRRSLDWFDFWLRDKRPDAPEGRAEAEEWNRLRNGGGSGRP